MKRTLVLAAIMLLTCSLAWADDSAPETGGACVLPDFTGLSPDQIAAAALEAGFQIAPNEVQVPPCPATFSCNSIPNCGKGSPCAVNFIGPCCQPAGGPPNLCCASGNIREIRCPCVCIAPPCSLQCINSTDVKLRC